MFVLGETIYFLKNDFLILDLSIFACRVAKKIDTSMLTRIFRVLAILKAQLFCFMTPLTGLGAQKISVILSMYKEYSQ